MGHGVLVCKVEIGNFAFETVGMIAELSDASLEVRFALEQPCLPAVFVPQLGEIGLQLLDSSAQTLETFQKARVLLLGLFGTGLLLLQALFEMSDLELGLLLLRDRRADPVLSVYTTPR